MKTLIFCGLLAALCAVPLYGHEPVFESGVLLQDGPGQLEVGHFSAPTSADWNNDGAKDLVVGQIIDGAVLLFLNQGTNLDPVFNGGAKIESGGSPIAVTWG